MGTRVYVNSNIFFNFLFSLFVPVGVVAQGYVFSVNQKSIQGNLPYGFIARGNGKLIFWKMAAFRRVWGTLSLPPLTCFSLSQNMSTAAKDSAERAARSSKATKDYKKVRGHDGFHSIVSITLQQHYNQSGIIGL